MDRKNLLAAAAAGAGAGAGGKKPRYGPIFYDPHLFTCYSLLSLLSLLSLAVAYYLGGGLEASGMQEPSIIMMWRALEHLDLLDGHN